MKNTCVSCFYFVKITCPQHWFIWNQFSEGHDQGANCESGGECLWTTWALEDTETCPPRMTWPLSSCTLLVPSSSRALRKAAEEALRLSPEALLLLPRRRDDLKSEDALPGKRPSAEHSEWDRHSHHDPFRGYVFSFPFSLTVLSPLISWSV